MEIKDLTIFGSKDKILDGITLTFYKGFSVFLTGVSAAGKTALLKEIGSMNSPFVKSYKSYQVVLEDKILKKGLVRSNYNFEDLSEEEMDIVLFLNIKEILNKKIEDLTNKEMGRLKLWDALRKKPKLLFIDQVLEEFRVNERSRIINYIINRLKITICYAGSNIEDALFFPYMVVLNEGIVAIEGKTLQVLEEEKLLKRLGVGLPFIVDLSLQLKLYGLVDKVYDDKRKLVEALWK